MDIRCGVIRDSSGKQLGGQEYTRESFDRGLWEKMNAGDKMVLPKFAAVPKDLGSYMMASFGNNQILTKMASKITGSVTGMVIKSL